MKETETYNTANNRPYVVCHMLTSLDGKIDGAFFSAPECGSALREYGRIRNSYECQAVLYGTTTLLGGYAEGLIKELPAASARYPKGDHLASTDVNNYIVAIDPLGVLKWSGSCVEKKGRARAHVIEALTEKVSEEYLAYLRDLGISYLFVGKEQLDCKVLLQKLSEKFTIKRLMIAGGGITNWSFLREELIDELSLVIAPVADGGTKAVSIFERNDFLSEEKSVAFICEAISQLEDSALWLRYRVKQEEGVIPL